MTRRWPKYSGEYSPLWKSNRRQRYCFWERSFSFGFAIHEEALLETREKLLEAREGETLSYSDLAESIGEPAAVRAVSNAVAGNPVAYLVPCHRVIGKGGDLHGYRWGLDVKKAILEYEGANPIWQ